jgi:hypothetical protein
MAKNAITDYSTTAASNTDCGGVDSQGTAPASNMDDLIRELMSHLAETNAGTSPWADTMTIGDAADLTKKLRFELSGFTTATTRVLTPPNFDGTIATLAGTETLTNKTLTSPVLNTPTINTPTVTGLDASTTAKGLVELATDAEAQTGTDTARAITAANLQAVTATTTRKGVAELATAAEVATGTDADRVPSVSVLGSHLSACKAWINFNGTGTPAIRADYNVASITDNGVGDYTINFSNALADANYVVVGLQNSTNTTTIAVTAQTTAGFTIEVSQSGVGPVDRSVVMLMVIGN